MSYIEKPISVNRRPGQQMWCKVTAACVWHVKLFRVYNVVLSHNDSFRSHVAQEDYLNRDMQLPVFSRHVAADSAMLSKLVQPTTVCLVVTKHGRGTRTSAPNDTNPSIEEFDGIEGVCGVELTEQGK